MPRAEARATLLAAALCWAASGEARAQEEVKSIQALGVSAEAATAMPSSQTGGWVPVRLRVESQRAAPTRLSISCQSGWDDVLAAEAELLLEPGASRSFDWLVPVAPLATGGSAISVALRVGDQHLGALMLRSYSSPSADELQLGMLMVGPDAGSASAAAAAVSDSPIAAADLQSGLLQVRPFARGMDDASLPQDWRAYSTLSMVVCDPRSAPSAAAAAALASWVRLGGVLVVNGPRQEASSWLERCGMPVEESFRLGFPSSQAADEPAFYRHGFGRIGLPIGAAPLELAAIARELSYVPLGEHERAPRVDHPDGPLGQRLNAFAAAIPGVDEIPKRSLTLLLLAFAVVAGPVQWARQRRRPERTWRFLFWTPLLAVGFALVVAALAVFAQGVGKKDAVVSFTWLAQGEHQAGALFSRQIFAGNSFGLEPRLEAGTLILPAEINLLPGSSERFSTQPEVGGALTGNWAPARIPVEWRGAWSGSLRAALQFRADGERVLAISGFDEPLRDLTWRDATGALWRADGALQPGASLALERIEEDGWQPELDFSGPSWPAQIPRELPRGCWRARSDAAPWIPACGVPASRRIALHWVFGETAEAP